MSTGKTTTEYRDGARSRKIELLLPVFEAHIAAAVGRAGALHPVTNLDDARLVHGNAESSLKGERTTIAFTDSNGRVRTKETYVFWNAVADLAGLPLPRYPSVATVRALVRHLDRRVKDLQAVTTSDLFRMAAGAA